MSNPSRPLITWLFTSRRDGRIVILQRPNAQLTVFLGATAVQRVLRPTGRAASGVSAASNAALAVWALDEIVRGVNPWRRGLGGAVLIRQARALVARRRAGEARPACADPAWARRSAHGRVPSATMKPVR